MEPFETAKDEEMNSSDELGSVDDFIKQLEEREKDLDISSDLVIEVGDSEVEHDNIHDTFTAELKPPAVNIPVESPVVPKQETDAQPAPVEQSVISQAQYDTIAAERKALRRERDELKDSLKRQQRDFDNYRNRTKRERDEMFKNLVGRLATQMLPVLDNLNRALDSAESSGAEPTPTEAIVFMEGIVLVNQQLNEVLAGMGVQPIKAVGSAFDPNFHEAVSSEETNEHPPQTVIQELLRGYQIDEK